MGWKRFLLRMFGAKVHETANVYASAKAKELGLKNPKTTGNLIRENVENGIVRQIFDALYTAKIYGNIKEN